MAKKTFIAVILIILLLTALLISCDQKEKTAVSIQILDGAPFKSSYMLGEQLSLSGASFLVTYSDGSTDVVKWGDGIVINGFDTAMPAEGKQMTVSYKEASVSLRYNVVVQAGLDTDFRLTMTAANGSSGTDISIVSSAAENVPGGVYAISFTVTIRECVFVSLSSPLGNNWKVSHTKNGNTIKVILYAEDAVPLTASGTAVRLTVQKNQGSRSSSVTISDIRISNGERDYIGIPSYSINL